MPPMEGIGKMKLEVKTRNDFALIRDQYDEIVLDKYLDMLSDQEAKLALRKAIIHSGDVIVITEWGREKLLMAILAAANPIKSILWGKDGYFLKVHIRRGFP
jgi:hypothetical protein